MSSVASTGDRAAGPWAHAPPPVAATGGIIARNTLINLAGRVVLAAVALLAVPWMVHALGTERYGLLMLFWVVLGYFGMVDMGVGRATTKFLADRLAVGDQEGASALVWTSLAVLVGLGIVGGAALAALAPVLIRHVLNVPASLNAEAMSSLYWLALFLPLMLSQSGMQGALEAQQRFELINAIEVPSGIINYLLPLLVLLYTRDLSVIVVVLLFSRLVVWGIYLRLCLRTMPVVRGRVRLTQHHLKDLLHFGAWLNVSNVLSPIMVYTDRFAIGTLLTVSAVAYYAAPFSLASRMWVISGSLLPVLFPAFSALAAQGSATLGTVYRRAVKYLFGIVLPVSTVLVILAPDLMRLWLGSDFAARSAPVLAWLAAGVLINCLAQVPYALIQASGRPDITAKFHLLEVLPFFALLWWMTARYGVVGAAVAWATRVTLDAVLLFVFADRLLPPEQRGLGFAGVLPAFAFGLYAVASAATRWMPGAATRAATLLTILGLAAVAAWHLWLSAEDKVLLERVRARLTAARRPR